MLEKLSMLKLMATGGIKIVNGKIMVMQIPFVFVPVANWVAFFKGLTKANGEKESEKLQYESSKEAGREFPRLFKKMGGDFTLYEFIKKYGGFSGWGQYEVMMTEDVGKNMIHSVVKCENSPLPEYFSPSLNSPKPVCFSPVAIVAGVVEGIFGEKHEGLETDCLGCGHDYCVFEIAPFSYLKKKYPTRVKEQLHWIKG